MKFKLDFSRGKNICFGQDISNGRTDKQTDRQTDRKKNGRRTESDQKSIIELSDQMSQILKRYGFILTCFTPNPYKMLPSFSLCLKKVVLCLEYYLFSMGYDGQL